jgi:hypothetical protein
MKKIILLAASLMIFISCKKNYEEVKIEYRTNANGNSSGGSEASGHIKIAVISDIHVIHPSLIHDNAQNGEPFKAALAHRPLIEYSLPIFSKVLSELITVNPDIVLIPGNLALDGERFNHQIVADNLKRLSAAGIKVYIVPGKYDINNPRSAEYYFDHSARIPNVSPAEFKSIYKDFGYDNTVDVIAKDPASLSYVAQPFPGLWVLSIDAVKYSPYAPSGRILPQTMDWILRQLVIAKEQNITVLGLMSHNLIEHLKDHNKIRPNTLIENWEADADKLITAGLKVIFTGTFHANDITLRQTGGKTLYDVETGCLVGPESPYRIMLLKNKELDISTELVTSIDVPLPGNMSFPDWSYQATSMFLDRFFPTYLTNTLGIPPRLLPTGILLAKNALITHLIGDENLSPIELNKINEFAAASPDSTKLSVNIVMSLWTDLNTKDNKWHIKLTDP